IPGSVFASNRTFPLPYNPERCKYTRGASTSLASGHLRLFGPGECGKTPILAPSKSTDWDTTMEGLRYTLNTHGMRISVPTKEIEKNPRVVGKQMAPGQ
ncbi:unnamed protein product, partial [Sphacelaria rigidula]